MSLMCHKVICEKVATTSRILTGRLTRPLPIIRGTHGINGYLSPLPPHTTGLRDSEAVKPHSRVPLGRESRVFRTDLRLYVPYGGAVHLHPEGGSPRQIKMNQFIR